MTDISVLPAIFCFPVCPWPPSTLAAFTRSPYNLPLFHDIRRCLPPPPLYHLPSSPSTQALGAPRQLHLGTRRDIVQQLSGSRVGTYLPADGTGGGAGGRLHNPSGGVSVLCRHAVHTHRVERFSAQVSGVQSDFGGRSLRKSMSSVTRPLCCCIIHLQQLSCQLTDTDGCDKSVFDGHGLQNLPSPPRPPFRTPNHTTIQVPKLFASAAVLQLAVLAIRSYHRTAGGSASSGPWETPPPPTAPSCHRCAPTATSLPYCPRRLRHLLLTAWPPFLCSPPWVSSCCRPQRQDEQPSDPAS